MSTQISAPNVQTSDALLEHVRTSVTRILGVRASNSLRMSMELEGPKGKGRFVVKIQAQDTRDKLFAQARDKDMYLAIVRAVRKFERVIDRHHGKRIAREQSGAGHPLTQDNPLEDA